MACKDSEDDLPFRADIVPNSCSEVKLKPHSTAIVYVDNSNLFIEGKKLKAKVLKLTTNEDPAFRIDYGNLLLAMLHGRKLHRKSILFGSTPPARDSLWKEIESKGIQVLTFERSHGREKELDVALGANAIEYACENRDESKNTTVVIASGDRDMVPVLEKLFDKNFKVEIAAFESGMSEKFRAMKGTTALLEIVRLDDLFDSEPSWHYTNRRWNPIKQDAPNCYREIPHGNTTQIFYFQNNFENNSSDNKKLQELADYITELLKLPCYYYCHPNESNSSSNLLIIFPTAPGEVSEVAEEYLGTALKDKKAKKGKRERIQSHCLDTFMNNRLKKFESAQAFFGRQKSWTEENKEMKTQFFDPPPSREGKECDFKFNCQHRSACKKDHDVKERECFANWKSTGESYKKQTYKSSPCIMMNHSTGFGCQYCNEERWHLCSGYHSEKEARCYECEPKSGEVGHRAGTSSSCHGVARCPFAFNCPDRHDCEYDHTQKEKECFKHWKDTGESYEKDTYKSYKCDRLGKCQYKEEKLSHLCAGYHDMNEARCYDCQPECGEKGHDFGQPGMYDGEDGTTKCMGVY